MKLLVYLRKRLSFENSTLNKLTLGPGWPSHRLISDKVHRLFVALSYFRPDRFVQLLSFIPTLIFLLYFLFSIDLDNTTGVLARLEERKSN